MQGDHLLRKIRAAVNMVRAGGRHRDHAGGRVYGAADGSGDGGRRRRPEGQRIMLGADWAYDTRDFVSDLRDRCVTPHVAQNTSGRCSAIDGRTTRHAGYVASQRIRKRIEEVFGWAKSAAGQGKTRVRFAFTLTVAAYNLIRLPRLLGTGR